MKTMTIGQLLDKLGYSRPGSFVYYDFCDMRPTSVSSWRGRYSEAALGWEPQGRGNYTVTAGELIMTLEKAIDGRSYGGWKGGEFFYTRDTPLHVDNPSESTGTNLVDVEYGTWFVMLITANSLEK